MIWFTADQHWHHANIIRFTGRPFDSVEEMDAEMVRRWNEVVDPNDTVYHLGDVTLGTRISVVNKLNGALKIVPGGHDKRWLRAYCPQAVRPFEVLPPLFTLELPGEGKRPLVIVLCHYPMASWDRSHHGSLHLHGHSHGKMPVVGKRMDVGVDCHDFYPVSLDVVLEQLKGETDGI